MSNGKLGYFCRTPADESRKRENSEPVQISQPGLHLKRNVETRQDVALSDLQESNDLPGLNRSGFFIDSTWPLFVSSENRGRPPVQKDTDDEFHDSDIDIFALFNAVDGIMRNGFLDVSELDKYSPADAEALNVPRLKEIWKHTTTGCDKCRDIIEALQNVRGAVKDVADIAEQNDGREHTVDRIKHSF
ncbi:MAG TPA: hypothetical protein VFI24_10170 [Pyrinomonadaceae bacterium]|nr:hypothetical protein [Pyrinomonadaceae bacterium]